MKKPKRIAVKAKKPNGETATLEIFYEPTKKGYVFKNVDEVALNHDLNCGLFSGAKKVNE